MAGRFLYAPDWRWLGLNQCNGALTIILYRPGSSHSLLSFNDMGHFAPGAALDGLPC